jgi:hypothetical protein
MSRRRRRITYQGLTERSINLFRYGLRLQHEGKEDTDLFRQVDRELCRELALKPWFPSPFEVTAGFDDEEDAIASVRPDHRPYYQHVINLRRSLVGAQHVQ